METEKWKKIIQDDPRYRGFVLTESPVKFCDLFANRDIPCVQLHSVQVFENSGKQYIIGFCGAFSWEDNVLEPLDGDSYSEDTPVYGYSWFTDEKGRRCLDILVGDEW